MLCSILSLLHVLHGFVHTLPSSLQGRSDTVDLNLDGSLMVDISDALSERDKVKFTVHTKVGFTTGTNAH